MLHLLSFVSRWRSFSAESQTTIPESEATLRTQSDPASPLPSCIPISFLPSFSPCLPPSLLPSLHPFLFHSFGSLLKSSQQLYSSSSTQTSPITRRPPAACFSQPGPRTISPRITWEVCWRRRLLIQSNVSPTPLQNSLFNVWRESSCPLQGASSPRQISQRCFGHRFTLVISLCP